MQQGDFFQLSSLRTFFKPPKCVIATAVKLLLLLEKADYTTVTNTYFKLCEEFSLKIKGCRLTQEEFMG